MRIITSVSLGLLLAGCGSDPGAEPENGQGGDGGRPSVDDDAKPNAGSEDDPSDNPKTASEELVEVSVSGRVVDGAWDGWSGAEGATITLKKAGLEAQADESGFFSLAGSAMVPEITSSSAEWDPKVDTLIISKAGYLTREYPISSYDGMYSFISLATATQSDAAMAVWEDVDFEKDPLNVEIHEEWEDDNNHYMVITYDIATWKGEVSKMGAYYAYPKNVVGAVPGIAQTHGGGGRARLSVVRSWANRGYAAVAISWNGHALTDHPGASTEGYTDWGAINPTQVDSLVSSFSIRANDDTIDDVDSPRNIRWYPLTYAFCRAVTFLQSRPEVDADKIGVHGYSMGGNVTTFALGVDDRIKVGAPQNGGEGYHYYDFFGGMFPAGRGTTVGSTTNAMMRGTIDELIEPHRYIQSTTAKILFQGSTNDHHARISKVSASWDLLAPEQEKSYRWAHAPRLDHAFSDDVNSSLYLWMDAQLMETGTYYPLTPASVVRIDESTGAASFVVTPDPGQEIVGVDIDYSYSAPETDEDGDLLACNSSLSCDDERIWLDAVETETTAGTYEAEIPYADEDLVVIMGHVTYQDSVSGQRLVVSTDLAQITQDMMSKARGD